MTVQRKIIFLAIIILLTFLLTGCITVGTKWEDKPIRWECSSEVIGQEIPCVVETNILVCNEENTHCEYIDFPIPLP